MENKNAPAFPAARTVMVKTLTGQVGTNTHEKFEGLTKREWFTGMALQGLLANDPFMQSFAATQNSKLSEVTNMAVAFADTLLKQLDNG